MGHCKSRVGFLIILTTCLLGWPGPESRAQQQPQVSEKNQPPRLQPLFGENEEGRRIRVLQPGMTVTVRARASDPDNHEIRFHWLVSKNGGTLDRNSGDVVTWTIGKSVKGIVCIAADPLGGETRRRLRPSRHPGVLFAGHVVSDEGNPIPDATVDVHGERARTDKNGFFKLFVKQNDADRFVFNIKRRGFGLVSKIYDKGVRSGRWTMRRATVAVVDPTQPISVQDRLSPQACLGPLSSRVDWSLHPGQATPRFVDEAGNLTSGPLPAEIKDAVMFVRNSTECSPGIRIRIPANSLVDAKGNLPTGKVEVSLTTVDLFSPDGMPGDYTVRTQDGNRVMQSFGAGIATVATEKGEPLQLKKGAKATLAIPVDPAQLKRNVKLRPTIPFLRYDERAGVWERVGTGKLDELDSNQSKYVATVDHLTPFNMDLVKVNQSCVKFDASAMPASFHLEIAVPMGEAAPVVKNEPINADPSQDNPNLHALYNLPSNTWILLTAFEEPTPGTLVPLGCYVVNTGDPQDPTDPNKPEYEYSACKGGPTGMGVTLIPVDVPASITVDGTGREYGPLPVVTYSLADQATGTETYPVGDGGFFFFGLFDTGSTRVRLYNEYPYFFNAFGDPNSGLICIVPNRITDGNYFGSDASFLAITAAETVRIRLSGLSKIDDATLRPPFGGPGSSDPAEVEVENVEVRPQPSGDLLDVTLIGAPVIHKVVALIDYTVEISKGPYSFYPDLILADSAVGIPGFERIDTVRGPNITFFGPNDDGIVFPDLLLKLETFGAPERYLLRNVAFNNGAGHVEDTATVRFLYDTGTAVTIINDAMAGTLGLVAGAGDFDAYGDGQLDGYYLDELVMTAPGGGTYVINNAAVCWDESRIQQPTLISAVIGANFFDQVPVLFDGPRNRLAIGPKTATPVTWIPLPRNCP